MKAVDGEVRDLRGLSTSERVKALTQQLSALGVDVCSASAAVAGQAPAVPRRGDTAQETSSKLATPLYVVGDPDAESISRSDVPLASEPQSHENTEASTTARLNNLAVTLPPALSDLFPGGGIARKTLATLNHSPLFAVELIASCVKAGGYVAVIDWPQLLLTQLVDYGVDLQQVMVIPDAGADPLAVVGMVVEGVDLVVFHTGHGLAAQQPTTSIPPRALRPLQAKMRRGRAAVVCVHAALSNVGARLDAHVTGFSGLGRGTGRIKEVVMEVSVAVKNQPLRTRTVVLGQQGIVPCVVDQRQARTPATVAQLSAV